MPGRVAAAAARHLLVASRRRPAARRCGACVGGRLRDREDEAALCDEQAAHMHGRIPGALPGPARGNPVSDPTAPDSEHDAWLREALRHAPDAGVAPPPSVSEMILREAQAKARVGAP